MQRRDEALERPVPQASEEVDVIDRRDEVELVAALVPFRLEQLVQLREVRGGVVSTTTISSLFSYSRKKSGLNWPRLDRPFPPVW